MVDQTATTAIVLLTVNSISRTLPTSATSLPVPPVKVVLQLRISDVSIPSVDERRIGTEIRDEIIGPLNIEPERVTQVLLLYIGNDDSRTVVAVIEFQSRKKRQSSDTVTFNAVEMNIQSVDQAEASMVQGMIDQLSNQVRVKLVACRTNPVMW